MSAMEGINSQTEPVANGTSNGITNTSSDPAPAPIQKRQIGIAQISSDLSNPSHCEIRGIITLLWPYSSLTKRLALNLAEPDVRLRSEKGQVKVSFTGSLGKHIGTQGLGIDDHLVLSLEGAEFVKTTPRDRRDVGWELKYTRILRGKITSRPTGDVGLDHEAQPEIEATPVVPVPAVIEALSPPPRSLPENRVNAIQNDDGEWSSPAFIKRARLSYGSLMSNDFDNFIGADGSIPGKGRKKARFEPRKSGTWRYQSESRSPSPEPEKEDTVMSEAEKPKPQMSEIGCQTDDLPYDEAAVQKFFRRSQAVGHEVRQDQHMLQDEGVQTMFDEAEIFSPAPVPFHQPSTTPFGNPPVPLFAQAQAQVPMGSTTPFGEPFAQSTTPMEPLPEHYQSIVSPLAAKSKAPVHQEGQWPSSLLESMGYRPASSLSTSITSTSSLRQSQQHETFSPVAPMQTMQPSLQIPEQHNSAARALEELSRIHQAQQFEDAAADYSDSTASVLQGSLNDVGTALSPPRQNIQQSMYPELPGQEHTFLTPAKPSFGSRQQSPQPVRSAPHSSRQSPAPISYPAQRYSRERSGTPANRGASPADSIDLTGDSDEDNEKGEKYSEDEGSAEEDDQVMPGESFDETKQRILEEAENESESDGEGYEQDEGDEGDEENMTEIKIPSRRGQPSMIPKRKERVDDEDCNDEGDMYEGTINEEGDNEDEKMSDEYNFNNRGVLLNPRPQRFSPGLDQDADIDEEGAGDTDEYYSEDERPASLQESVSDDESDIQDYNSDANAHIDPDNAIMPGEDTEQEWDEEEEEEEEESELEHDQEEYERYEGGEEDMGPAYGHSGSQSRAVSQPSGPPVVIDLLSSDDDDPAPPPKAVAKSSPPPPASKPAAAAQQNESGDEDEQLQVQANDSMSEGEDGEIAEHQKEIYQEDKEIEEKYHEVGDMDHHSPTPPPAVIVEMIHDKLRAQEDEGMSDADEGKEDATEVAEQERMVYEEEVEDEIRSQEGHEREASSPMLLTEEEAEEEIGEEGSGYEDEDATAEEIEQPKDMVSMDGASESKHLTSSPAKRLFRNHPPNRAASPLLEKVVSVEPPAQDDGEQADVEDFEVPKENFDTAKAIAKPIDPAILAEHDEDRPVPMGISAEAQDEEVALAHELADETHGESLVSAAATSSIAKSKSQEAAEEVQIAMAAILAERDEDRPVPMGVSAEVQDEEVAQAHEVAVRFGDRPVQARQNAISGPSSSARAEAAQLALEGKLDQEIEEDLRESKDQELTEEAQRDIKMADIVPPAKYDDKTQPPSELKKEIERDMEKTRQQERLAAPVKAGIEPGPKGDPEDVDMDGDVVASDQELEAFSEADSEQAGSNASPSVKKSVVEPGPRGEPEDVDMHSGVVGSDQELEAFSGADADSESVDEEPSPATVKSAVEPGPRGDPEDADMDGDVVESDNGLDADDADTHMACNPMKVVTAVIIDDNAEVIVASEVEEAEDEDDYEDPSSQLFEEMSYIEQVEHTKTLSTVKEVEETSTAVKGSQQTVESQFIVSSHTQNSVWATRQATQQSQQMQESMEASVFSQVVQDATSFETLPALDAEAAVKEPEVGELMAEMAGIEEVMENELAEAEPIVEEPNQGITLGDNDQAMAENVEVAPVKHTRSHDKPAPATPAKKSSQQTAQKQPQENEPESMVMDVDEHPASHTRSHGKLARKAKESKSQDVTMSIELDEHPATHTRSHDKRVEKLQENDRSGSPAEHTRSHDALAGHCVEDEVSAKGLQASTRRKSSSRKSTEQPSEQVTPPKPEQRAVTPLVEIPVSSAVEDVEETPPKRVTRSRRGTQESVKPASPPKTRKRALTPVVEVEVPASTIEEVEAETAEAETAPDPPKRVPRSRQHTAEPEQGTSPKTRRTRRKSLTPVDEVPASSHEHAPEEPAPEPPKRTTRTRKASNASVTKAVTPPRTRRMSLRSQASPDTTNMTDESASVQLQAIDEEDDELPDPGAAALLEYDESPEKVRTKLSLTSAPAPAPAHNTRARRNASPELGSSGQPVIETPIKTRARALRSQSISQGSGLSSSQLASGLIHETPNQSRDPAAEAIAEAASPAAPMTPANKSSSKPLGSPSTWATLTPSAVAAQITKTLRTQLPAYTPLKNIKNHLRKKIDVIAVCVDTPVPPVKSKNTPHDYALKFFVTEPGSIGTVKEVTAFHHFKKCLPEMRAGNVLLLRNFLVVGQNNGCLRSEKDSSWAVWRKEGEAPKTKSDVPLEFEGGEDGYARQLKVWWEEKVEVASKEKMKTLAQKGAGKK